MRRSTRSKIDWQPAPDIKRKIIFLLDNFGLNFRKTQIYTVRSTGAKTRAVARIWGLSKLWQQVLKTKPAYIIEVIAERFDHLPQRQQDEILLHELAHIPANFSGALAPHKRGKGHFHDKLKRLLSQYRRNL